MKSLWKDLNDKGIEELERKVNNVTRFKDIVLNSCTKRLYLSLGLFLVLSIILPFKILHIPTLTFLDAIAILPMYIFLIFHTTILTFVYREVFLLIILLVTCITLWRHISCYTKNKPLC